MQPQNDYGFILDDTTAQSSGPNFLQDPKKRNIIAGLFVAVVLLLVFITVSVFLSAGKTDISALQSVAVQQNRIIKLTSAGLQGAKDPSTRSKMTVLQAFLLSDFAESKRLLGSSLSEGLLTTSYAPSIDTELNRAAQRNQYDAALLENVDQLIVEYKKRLSESINAYQSSTGILPVLETSASNILTYEEPVVATE